MIRAAFWLFLAWLNALHVILHTGPLWFQSFMLVSVAVAVVNAEREGRETLRRKREGKP